MWIESVQNGPVYEVEDYVVEQSINGGHAVSAGMYDHMQAYKIMYIST